MLSMENLNTTCCDFMANSALNTLPDFGQTRIFQSPLIGVASAKDPLFLKLKEAVAPHHISPEEWLPSAQSIISFDRQLEPTRRDYTGIFDYCIDCYQCIPRCDFNAITKENGKNHDICSQKVDGITRVKYAPRYGCGKCNTNVPCEMERP